MQYKHLFGPVASRRLGISLGIDLIPYKTCSMDCLYCECGKTTNHTLSLSDDFLLDNIKKELVTFLKESPKLDYITFAGSGEPLLYKYFDDVVHFLKDNFPEYKLALLTNSLRLLEKSDWSALFKIDLFVPSLDAALPESFSRINRPAQNIDLNHLINVLSLFKQNYSGKFHLEVFLLKDVNDSIKDLAALKKAVDIIQPDLIQINTLDRPGTEKNISPITIETAMNAVQMLAPHKVEIVAKNVEVKFAPELADKRELVLQTIKRRPSTKNDLLSAIAIAPDDLDKLLLDLKIKNRIIIRYEDRGEFYFLKE